MPTLDELSPSQFRAAIKLSERIDSLRQRLQAILGNGRSASAAASKTKGKRGRKPAKRTMSPEGRARIAAAAKARWAKFRGEVPSTLKTAKTTKKKGGITPEGRARLSAAMKARWVERKKRA